MRPALNPLAAKRIEYLRTVHGVEPTLDETIRLHECGKAITHPVQGKALTAASTPALAGHVWLWPMTIGAAIWYQDVLWPRLGNTRLALHGLAYTLAHSRDCEHLYALDVRKLKATVRAWAGRLACTLAELICAIERVAPSDGGKRECPECGALVENDDDTSDVTTLDCDALVGWLSLRCGQSPEFWRWGPGMDFSMAQMARALRMAQAKGAPPDPNDPMIKATHRMNMVCVDILKAHGVDTSNMRAKAGK